MKHFLYYIIISLLLSFSFSPKGSGQPAPVTTLSIVENATPGSQVTVLVTVTGFNNIGSAALTLDYDFSSIQFVSATLNLQLASAGNFATGDNDLGNGDHRLIMGWYGNGTTLTDNSILITIIFNYSAGSTILKWYDNGPSCAYTDFQGIFLNDSPSSSFFIDGRVCGTVGSGIISGRNTVCSGSSGISYTVSPITGAQTYLWSVPAGSVITAGQSSSTIIVDYSASAVSGDISVTGVNNCMSGQSSLLQVTVLPPPVAFAGNDTTITQGASFKLHSSSLNAGVFDYTWYPADMVISNTVQNPVTVNINSSTLFKVVVASPLSLCRDSDLILVTVNIPTASGGDDIFGEALEQNPDKFIVYPNPVREILIIKSGNGSPGRYSVRLFSLNGSLVEEGEGSENDKPGEYIINVGSVPPGIYYLVISSIEKRIIHKVIVI